MELDQARCHHLVTQYLLSQGWQLVDPEKLGAEIFVELARQSLSGDTAVKAVYDQIWPRYGKILHDCCCQPGGVQYEQAWRELHHWLERQTLPIVSHPQDREEVIQETLIELQERLRQNGLKAPRTLWAYVLQTVRRKAIDLNRRRTAVKRGEDKGVSLEELDSQQPDAEKMGWAEKLALDEAGQRKTEDAVSDQEIREQLHAFFRQYLPSELQRLVAGAHFLDGLSPAQIAALMGKRPHEIRMIKARVVQTLRDLPPEARQTLLDILGEINGEEPGV